MQIPQDFLKHLKLENLATSDIQFLVGQNIFGTCKIHKALTYTMISLTLSEVITVRRKKITVYKSVFPLL